MGISFGRLGGVLALVGVTLVVLFPQNAGATEAVKKPAGGRVFSYIVELEQTYMNSTLKVQSSLLGLDHLINISWGDGESSLIQGACLVSETIDGARYCAASKNHVYAELGVYPITVTGSVSGGLETPIASVNMTTVTWAPEIVGSVRAVEYIRDSDGFISPKMPFGLASVVGDVKTVVFEQPSVNTVVPAEGVWGSEGPIPVTGSPWTPPDGFNQPVGWKRLLSGATYVPCSTIDWYFDRAGELKRSNKFYTGIAPALARISKETGLKFHQTSDPALTASNLRFDWVSSLSWHGVNTAGIGGPNGEQNGSVAFSAEGSWVSNANNGFGFRDGQPGNGWLIVHEVLHVLGFDHTGSRKSVMYHEGIANSFSAGDLDGLHTMYRDNPCPTV